jgi:hypothetical protein
MSVDWQIDPRLGEANQVGLRLRCTRDEAEAIRRAVVLLFPGRTSPVLPSFHPEFSFCLYVTASEGNLAGRWPEVERRAGLAGPPPGADQGSGGPTDAGQMRPRPQPHPPTPQRPSPGARPQRAAVDTAALRGWERRFKAAVKVVVESGQQPIAPAISSSPFEQAIDAARADELEEVLLLDHTLPAESLLRAQIALYARTGQHDKIVAISRERRDAVLALPPSGLLVEQLLRAHLAAAEASADSTLAQTGSDLAREFLPELERLRQSDAIWALLRSEPTSAVPEETPAAPATISERLQAITQLAPAERLAPLQSLRAQYQQATPVRLALAEAHVAVGDLEAAAALYRGVVDEGSADSEAARIGAAAALIDLGRAAEALAVIPEHDDLVPRLAGLRGVALHLTGEIVGARRLLEQAWSAGERDPLVALHLARALATAGLLEQAAAPYSRVLDVAPGRLDSVDCYNIALTAALGGFGDIPQAEKAEHIDRLVARAGRRLRDMPEGSELLQLRVDFRRAEERPDRLREAAADWLEYLAESADLTGLDGAARLLRDLQREGALTREMQFYLLESLEGAAAALPGMRDLLALEYQSIAVDELAATLRLARPMPPYVGDLRRGLHFLSRDVADDLASAIEEERRALADRSMDVPAQVVEEERQISLVGVRLTMVGGHSSMRREVERELRERHQLTDFLEVAPSSEDHVDRAKVRDRVVGRDIVAVITGYTGHDLTNLVRDLQRAGEVTGRVIWPACRGKSGVVREIVATLQDLNTPP